MLSRVRWIALCWLVASVAAPARADDQHYNDFPLGTRALGLGGAFTAIANDPSGLYYNPAGLVATTRTNVSVSTSLYGLETTAPSAREFVKDVNFSQLVLNIIPGEVGATYALGSLERGKPAKGVIGFDVVVPSSRSSSYHQQSKVPDGTLTTSRTSSDETLWAGAGGAYLINDRVSIGASLFFLHRTVLLNERTTSLTSDSGYVNEATTLDVFDDSALAVLGVHWRINDEWRFGATWLTPSVHLRSGGSAEVSRVQWGAGGAAPMQQDLVADTSTQGNAMQVDTSSNGGFRLGVAYVRGKLFTVSADLSGFFPVSYTRLSFQDPQIESTITVPVDVTRLMTVNGAIGGEWRCARHVSVAGGFFTDFSSAPVLHPQGPDHEAPAGRNALPHDNLYGFSVAAGYYSDHSLTRLGMTMVTGFNAGQDVQYESASNAWSIQPLDETLVYVFISSTFRY